MERGAKSARAKVEARPAVARKPRKAEVSSDLQFKKRLAEASEQHAAISEILGVISSSPGDVKPVLATVAERPLTCAMRRLRKCCSSKGTCFAQPSRIGRMPAQTRTTKIRVE